MANEDAMQKLGQTAGNTQWDGSPMVLQVAQSATMPQTPIGTMIIAARDLATADNAGTLTLTSGGAPPLFLTIPALTPYPTLTANNWQGQALTLTNVSASQNVPIMIQAIGPGIPGITPVPLPFATPVTLDSMQAAQGSLQMAWAQLLMKVPTANLSNVAILGGPPDAAGNNGYLIALNYPMNSGPGTGNTPPPGYFATTVANTYTFQFNWGASFVYVVNLTPPVAGSLNVTLANL
jgi:hypothetical protein